jgi:hypothetical protein
MAPITLEDVAAQFFSALLLYALAFLVVSFIGVKIILAFNPCMSRRLRSLLLLIPLFTPLIVYVVSFPATSIQIMPNDLLSGNFNFETSTSVPFSSSVQSLLPQLQFFVVKLHKLQF